MPDGIRRNARGSSLFAQVLALVLLALVISQLVAAALQLLLPPAPPSIMGLPQFVQHVRSGSNALVRINGAVPPEPDMAEDHMSRALERRIAGLLGMEPDDVRVDPGPQQGGRLVSAFQLPDGTFANKPVLIGHFRVAVRQAEGSWTIYEPAGQLSIDSEERRFVLIFMLNGFIMLPMVWWFARRLSRPLEQLADAAESIGRDPAAPTPDIAGSSEVERASVALRAMQQRLSSFVTERTRMLGAIAHDLRTPLTRLAFRVEQLSGDSATAIRRDVAEMSSMVESSLAYARGADPEAERRRLELGALAEQVAADMVETGRDVAVSIDTKAIVLADPMSMRRIVANLVNNALLHGGSAEIRLTRKGDIASLDILDTGDGCPGMDLERLFEPFVRADIARGRHTGGTGLGLPVARSLARAHGGDVTLERRPEGGMRARLSLPIAQPTSA